MQMKKELTYQKRHETLIYMIMVFFISTTCVCICEGVLGMIFLKGKTVYFGAFFSPPLFGLISVVLGFISRIHVSKEMSVKEVVIRQLIHLFLIEAVVFGLNYLSDLQFSTALIISLFITIALIYGIVHVVLLLNDRRSAMLFNEQLKKYQKQFEE